MPFAGYKWPQKYVDPGNGAHTHTRILRGQRSRTQNEIVFTQHCNLIWNWYRMNEYFEPFSPHSLLPPVSRYRSKCDILVYIVRRSSLHSSWTRATRYSVFLFAMFALLGCSRYCSWSELVQPGPSSDWSVLIQIKLIFSFYGWQNVTGTECMDFICLLLLLLCISSVLHFSPSLFLLRRFLSPLFSSIPSIPVPFYNSPPYLLLAEIHYWRQQPERKGYTVPNENGEKNVQNEHQHTSGIVNAIPQHKRHNSYPLVIQM